MNPLPVNNVGDVVAPVTCKKCGKVGTTDDHYTYRLKSGALRPTPKCRVCHNAGNYVKKGVGWGKLDPDTQNRIRLQLADRRLKISDIARDENISYESLRRWVSKGHCV